MAWNIIMAYILGFTAGAKLLFLALILSEKYTKKKWVMKTLIKIKNIIINNIKT